MSITYSEKKPHLLLFSNFGSLPKQTLLVPLPQLILTSRKLFSLTWM